MDFEAGKTVVSCTQKKEDLFPNSKRCTKNDGKDGGSVTESPNKSIRAKDEAIEQRGSANIVVPQKQRESDIFPNSELSAGRLGDGKLFVPSKSKQLENKPSKLPEEAIIPKSSGLMNDVEEKSTTVPGRSRRAAKVRAMKLMEEFVKEESLTNCDPQSRTFATSETRTRTHSCTDVCRNSQNSKDGCTCTGQCGCTNSHHAGKYRMCYDEANELRKEKMKGVIRRDVKVERGPVDKKERLGRFKKESQMNNRECSHRDQTRFVCRKCRVAFKMESALVRHQLVHHQGSPVKHKRTKVHGKSHKEAPKIEEKPKRKKTQSPKPTYTAGTRLHRCPKCGHGFRKKTDLQRHERVHTGEKPYACKLCKARFNRKFILQCHENTHNGIKPHSCSRCGKGYSRRYDLVKHVKSVHTKELHYVCSKCGKAFVSAHNLTVHERIHTKSQPYMCPTCGHRSNHLTDLKKHMLIHTKVKPYQCKFCSMSFRQTSSLKSHTKKSHMTL